MAKKYRFRKMYFICDDKKVISPNVQMTCAYQFKANADQVAKERGPRKIYKMWEDKTIPIPITTVEGFYLVPEQLYEILLKDHVEGE